MAGNPAFGDRIRELRELKKAVDPTFSLRQFAERVGISATFLSKVERGEFDPPAPDKIKRMAELLGIDADELLAIADLRNHPEWLATLINIGLNYSVPKPNPQVGANKIEINLPAGIGIIDGMTFVDRTMIFGEWAREFYDKGVAGSLFIKCP